MLVKREFYRVQLHDCRDACQFDEFFDALPIPAEIEMAIKTLISELGEKDYDNEHVFEGLENILEMVPFLEGKIDPKGTRASIRIAGVTVGYVITSKTYQWVATITHNESNARLAA